VAEWAYYPTAEALIEKFDEEVPAWKWPLWFWVKQFGAWPSSPEAMASAFDYNRAPFFQSFFEVRVEPSKGRVRLLPYGAHGRLRWGELAVSPAARPAGATPDSPVEWVIEMMR
jgi:hypothetical protein